MGPVHIGPFSIRRCGEPAFTHQMRQCPHLGPCARQHHAGFIGVRPLVAVPVVDQTGQRLFFIVTDMEPPTEVERCNGRCRIPVAQRLGGSDLPRRKYKFPLHVLVIRKNAGAPLLCHRIRQEPCPLRCLALDMGQDILQVRFLAPYAVHPDTANRITDQSQPRSRFHRLLLLGVAREDDLRPMALGEPENVMRLAGRQHPRLIDDNDGVSIDLDASPCGKTLQFIDAEWPRIDIVAQRHGRAPSHGGGNNALSVFAIEIGNGPQCRGLARARRSFDNGYAAPGRRDRPYCRDLFFAQRIARLQ